MRGMEFGGGGGCMACAGGIRQQIDRRPVPIYGAGGARPAAGGPPTANACAVRPRCRQPCFLTTVRVVTRLSERLFARASVMASTHLPGRLSLPPSFLATCYSNLQGATAAFKRLAAC